MNKKSVEEIVESVLPKSIHPTLDKNNIGNLDMDRGYRNGVNAFKKFLTQAIERGDLVPREWLKECVPVNAVLGSSVNDGWNACLDECKKIAFETNADMESWKRQREDISNEIEKLRRKE